MLSILANIAPILRTKIYKIKGSRPLIIMLKTVIPANEKKLHTLFAISLPISIGAGIDFFLSAGIYLCLICSDVKHLKILGRNLASGKIFLGLLGIFYLIYWLNYEPTIYRRIENLIISKFNSKQWFDLLGWIILSIFPLFGLNGITKKIQFIALELIGCVFFSSIIIVYSKLNYPPPYYGNLHNPLFGYAMNSTGVANLLSMCALLFYGQLLYKSNQTPLMLRIFISLLFAFSIWQATLIQQRTFFIISFLLCPLLVIYFKFINKNKINIYTIVIATIPLFYFLLKPFIEKNFEAYRKLTVNIANDLRFRLYKNWYDQFLEDPFARVHVTLLENPAHGIPTAEFHNFFMDVSRFSGGGALLLALILFLYIIFKLVQRLKTNPPLGQLLIFLFIPLFLILCTAVFPEGELQFFLIILSIAALNESANIESKVET
jgi:hypothetical protein